MKPHVYYIKGSEYGNVERWWTFGLKPLDPGWVKILSACASPACIRSQLCLLRTCCQPALNDS